MEEFLDQLRQRKLVQWTLGYAAAAFALIQVLDVIGQRFDWPSAVMRVVIVALAIGMLVTLVLAWYHGERGAQRVSGAELLVLALLLTIGGGLLWQVSHKQKAAAPNAVDVAPAPDAGQAPTKSIAVLAFSDLSPGHDQEYFSDGLSEELINALGRLRDLKVIGRTSSFQFKNRNEDSRVIAAKLGVAYLVEGSVRKAADRVRIAVQLVKAADGSNSWSETYDRDLKDIFALQSEIAKAVTGELQLTLLGPAGEPAQSDAPPSRNPEAYQALLKGNFLNDRRNLQDQRAATVYYEQAIALDPDYALAYARLASGAAETASIYGGLSAAERSALQAKARAAGEKAMKLNPDLYAVHVARCSVLGLLALDFAGAEAECRRALDLAPQNSLALVAYARWRAALGHFEEGVHLSQRAIAVDPLAGRAYGSAARLLMRLGRYAEAETMQRKLMELQPQASQSWNGLALIDVLSGRKREALENALKEGPGLWRNFSLALAHDANGDRAAADVQLNQLIAANSEDGAYQIADVYAARDDAGQAFAWLEKALQVRDPGVTLFLTDPFVARYKDDPRYAAFARKIGVIPAT